MSNGFRGGRLPPKDQIQQIRFHTNSFSSEYHEAGMVRLSINKGRKHGIRPNDIVGAIARHADIPGSAIGKIHIEDKHSLVDVPEELVTQVLAANGEVFIRRLPVYLQRAA